MRVGESLCHLSSSGVHWSRRTRGRQIWHRCMSWRSWRRKKQKYELGCVLLRLLEELLHLRWGVSIRGANFLPVYFLAMRLGKSNRPFDTLFTNESFIARTGYSMVSKASTSFLRLPIGNGVAVLMKEFCRWPPSWKPQEKVWWAQ
jgi:hypothetical protein